MPRTKSRGNGQGTAYKRGRTWEAQVIVGWKPPTQEGGHPVPIKRRKGGFKTKAEALAACEALATATGMKHRPTLLEIYDQWEPWYENRIDPSTMGCYSAAFKHFSDLHNTYIDLITAGDLQDCMDKCPAGKRTHQNMKVVAGLLWAYAYDRDFVTKKVTENLYIGNGKTTQREPLTEQELEIIQRNVTTEPFADYVYALCFLGFRPGEFLALKKADLRKEDGVAYLIGGSKTDAGRDRLVPIPAQISWIIENRKNTVGTDLLFPQYCYSRKGEFTGYKEMSDAYFREAIFKPLMRKLGIAEGKVPYCARHTYSDKLRDAAGDDKTKAAIMGHTDYAFTQSHYQSVRVSDLRAVAESLS